MPSEYDGSYSVTVEGFSGIDGTLSINIENSSYSYTPSGGSAIAFTPSNSNPGSSLNFSVTISGTKYNFNGAFHVAEPSKNPPKPARYTGSVNDNSPKAANGSWTATQTNPMPEEVGYSHKKAV